MQYFVIYLHRKRDSKHIEKYQLSIHHIHSFFYLCIASYVRPSTEIKGMKNIEKERNVFQYISIREYDGVEENKNCQMYDFDAKFCAT